MTQRIGYAPSNREINECWVAPMPFSRTIAPEPFDRKRKVVRAFGQGFANERLVVHGPTSIPPDATEEQLIGLWLHGKSPNTIRAYRRHIAAFRAFIGKLIRLAYLGDLQRYADDR